MMNKLKIFLLFIFQFLTNCLLLAQDGTLDLTFDYDGIVTTNFNSSGDYGYGIATQTDGKIIVVGYSNNGSNFDFAIARYNTDGSLDASFDSDGKVTTAIGIYHDYARDVAVQSDGKIVVVGYANDSYVSDYKLAVVRYDADGSLDNTFGSDGKVTTSIGNYNAYGYSLAIQSDGKIVVAGTYEYGPWEGYYVIAIVRYNMDGSLDDSFGDNGVVTPGIDSEVSAYDVMIQSDGKIVIACTVDNASGADFALVRCNSDGSMDNSFDTDGVVITNIMSNDDRCYGVAIQSDSKIVAAGYCNNGSNKDFSIVRYNYDGSLDLSFGSGGIVSTPIGSYDDYGRSVAIQSDGKILVAGYYYTGISGDFDFVTVRYDTDGSLDYSFGSDGIAAIHIGSRWDQCHSVVIQSDGKIVVAGYTQTVLIDEFSVARYNNPSVMPVELTTFTANVNDNFVLLYWRTETEVNNHGFEIERTIVGKIPAERVWQKIGFIEGYGNSNSPKEYTFKDNSSLLSGKVLYRLKQIDNDGQY